MSSNQDKSSNIADEQRQKELQDAIADQQQMMKEYKKAKKTFSPVKDLPRLHPEPDYIIKTRPPMWDDWRLNIFRGLKENRLKMDANKLARRKCWETGLKYEECAASKGLLG